MAGERSPWRGRVAGALCALAAAGALCVLGGCAQSTPPPPPPPPPPPLECDAPLCRLRASYQYEVLSEYGRLFTADFRYTFSAQTDPDLVTTYANNWGKLDELESAKHLFAGFTNAQGEYLPAARGIDLAFLNERYFADPAHSDSTRYYAFAPVSEVDLAVEVPAGDSTTTYRASGPHNFYLVRGDAAVLDPDQAADSTRWYIRRWDDLAAAAPGPVGAAQANVSWGWLKARYR